MKNKYICAVDLGSSKLACALVEFKDRRQIKNFFFDYISVKALDQARIRDITTVRTALSQLIDRLKRKSNIKIRDIHINISCLDLITRHNIAVIPLAERGSKLITSWDLQKVKEQALALAACWEEEIIQSIPISYSVDDKDGFLNPLGLYAHKLGVDLLTISTKTSYFETLHNLFNKLGYELKDIFVTGIEVLKYILDKDNLNRGVYAFLDVGSQITDIVIYENRQLIHIGAILFGGDNFTEKISQHFNISFDLAEDLKISHGTLLEGTVSDKEILIKDGNFYRQISQKKLSEVLTQETELFVSYLKDYFKKNIKDKKIDRIFACGKSLLLEGLLEKIELDLGINVRMISYNDFPLSEVLSLRSVFSVSQFLEYLNCLKVIYEVMNLSKKESFPHFVLSGNIFKRSINWVKQLYQEYF